MSWWNRPGLKQFDGILCDGAVRSGKTLCMTVGFFLWSMACFQGEVFGICGRSIGALRRNIIEHLPRWLGPGFAIREQRKGVTRIANGTHQIHRHAPLLVATAWEHRFLLQGECFIRKILPGEIWIPVGNSQFIGSGSLNGKYGVAFIHLLALDFRIQEFPGSHQVHRLRACGCCDGDLRGRLGRHFGGWCTAAGLCSRRPGIGAG